MSTRHARSAEPLDPIRWSAIATRERHSRAIVKTADMELSCLSFEAGERMPREGSMAFDGPCVLHCLAGDVVLRLPGESDERHEGETPLRAGQLLWLDAHVEHALEAGEEAIVLWTLVARCPAENA